MPTKSNRKHPPPETSPSQHDRKDPPENIMPTLKPVAEVVPRYSFRNNRTPVPSPLRTNRTPAPSPPWVLRLPTIDPYRPLDNTSDAHPDPSLELLTHAAAAMVLWYMHLWSGHTRRSAMSAYGSCGRELPYPPADPNQHHAVLVASGSLETTISTRSSCGVQCFNGNYTGRSTNTEWELLLLSQLEHTKQGRSTQEE